MITTWIIVALLAVAAFIVWRVVATGDTPQPGAEAPGFSLPDATGALRSLAEFRGRWVVLYFYPRADTPGCTEQAARFRDTLQDFEAQGAAVCGVSVDGADRLAAFATRYRLPFALISDRAGIAAARYGSLLDLGLVKVARRNTFLIDPQGRIARVYRGVNPAANAAEVLADLCELRA